MLRPLLSIIIILCAVIGTGASRHHHTGPVVDSGGRCVVSAGDCTDLEFMSVEVRCAISSTSATRRGLNRWSLVWNVTQNGYSYATLEFDNRHTVDGIDEPKATLRAGHIHNGRDTVTAAKTVTSGLSFDYHYNSVLMEWSDGETRIYTGNRDMSLQLRFPSQAPASDSCGVHIRTPAHLLDIVTECRKRPDVQLYTGYTAEDIERMTAAAPAGSPAGRWEYLDRENDPDRARPGGRYTLAVVPDSVPGRYIILYTGGAQVNARQWQAGMIKGYLTATPFTDHYTLVWYDTHLPCLKDISLLGNCG